MLQLVNLGPFLLAATLIIIVPGPATLFVVGSATRSVRSAVSSTAGIIAGDIVLIVLAGIGLSAIVAQSALALAVIRTGGALYIAYLGVQLLRNSGRAVQLARARHSEGLLGGLLITLTNAKPILFFSAFFPMFIADDAQSWTQSFFTLAGIFELINILYFAIIIVLVTKLRGAAAVQKLDRGLLSRASGLALLGCAVFMALA